MSNGGEADQLEQAKLYEQILHSDRATVDLGLFALKVVMTVNAGALLALVAAVEHLAGAPGAAQFATGLMTAVLAAILAYFYQGFVTANLWTQFHAEFPVPGEPPPSQRAGKALQPCLRFIIGLVLVSYGAFGYGTWSVISSLSSPP